MPNPQPSPARRLALDVLTRTPRPYDHIEDTLQRSLARSTLSPEDRALAARIVLGTTKRRGTLEHLLGAFSDLPRSRVEKKTRINLLAAFYQVLFLEKVPHYAVLSDAVQLAKRYGTATARFTNAVLRSLTRAVTFHDADPPPPSDPSTLPLPPARVARFKSPVFDDPAVNLRAHLTQVHAMPPFLVSRWLKRLGPDETLRVLTVANEPPPIFLRCDPAVLTMDSLTALLDQRQLEWTPTPRPDALLLHRAGDLSALASEKGLFIQDLSAMEVVDALDLRPHDRVLDLCAAPGGKSAHIAASLQPPGALLAVDSSLRRLRLVARNLRKTRFRRGRLLAADARLIPSTLAAHFNKVLLDVPCTNTGVLRRRAEARWRLTPKSIDVLAALQTDLLRAALDVLAPGGRLVYSTCSIEPEENRDLVQRVLDDVPDAHLASDRLALPASDGPDGGYFAVIERNT